MFPAAVSSNRCNEIAIISVPFGRRFIKLVDADTRSN